MSILLVFSPVANYVMGPLRECDSIGLTFCRCYCASMVLVVVCRVISQRHYESTVRYNHLTVTNISLSCSRVSAWRTTIPVFLLPPLPFSVVAICITNEKVEVENVGSLKKKTGKFSQTAQIAVARTSSNNNNSSQLSVNQMENRAKLWLHTEPPLE